MSVEQKIQRHILLSAIQNGHFEWEGELTTENISEVWSSFMDEDAYCDYVDEFRTNGEETGLPTQYSRHYECEEVACQLSCGAWVGWTHWYGGGKHGEPGSIEWMSKAYEVDVIQETRIVNVFKKKEVTQ